MKIAVNTPNGNIGRVLTGQLLDAGADVVLLTRSPDKVKQFEERGATVHVGDLADGDFVTKATRGVDTLFWLTPSDYQTDDLRGSQKRLGEIAAAAVRANKIQRVMDLSSVGAQHGSGVGPIGGLHDVEKILEKTDADLIHLRPGYFMENYFLSAETIGQDGNVYMPVGADLPMWMIATSDIGVTAAELLRQENWEKRAVIELVGPEETTFERAAKTIGEVLGKNVTHVQVTPDQAGEAMSAMGINSQTIDIFNEMYEGFGNGRVGLEGEPRHTTTSLTKFARETFLPVLRSMGS